MRKMTFLTRFSFVLLVGCSGSESPESDNALRYTIRDSNGVRASRNRESVLKTVGMTKQQIQQWASDPDGAAERRLVGDNLVKLGVRSRFTLREDRVSVSSHDKDSASRALKMDYRELLAWVTEENAAGEGRSVTLKGWGLSQIIWRGSSGKVLYTLGHEGAFRTSSRQDSDDDRGLQLDDPDQIRAWVEAERGLLEHRSAGRAHDGFLEMISRGTMEVPPGLWHEWKVGP
jgi:hypothetical protein